MTAKEYLGQIRLAEIRIRQMEEHLTGSSYVTRCFFELSEDKLPVYWEVDKLYEE